MSKVRHMTPFGLISQSNVFRNPHDQPKIHKLHNTHNTQNKDRWLLNRHMCRRLAYQKEHKTTKTKHITHWYHRKYYVKAIKQIITNPFIIFCQYSSSFMQYYNTSSIFHKV